MAATDRVSDALIDRTASQSAAGRLIVETIPNGGTTNPGYVRIQDGQSSQLAQVAAVSDSYGEGFPGLQTISLNMLHSTSLNGALRARSANASDLAAQSGLGVAMVAEPGWWTVFASAAVASAVTITRAAGGAGIRHIAKRKVAVALQVSGAAQQMFNFNLRDGASGAGTILWQTAIGLGATAGQQAVLAEPGSDPGTAATAMTLETTAGIAGIQESVILAGFDAS